MIVVERSLHDRQREIAAELHAAADRAPPGPARLWLRERAYEAEMLAERLRTDGERR